MAGRNLHGQTHAHADVYRTHAKHVASIVNVHDLQHLHVLFLTELSLERVHRLDIQQHLPCLLRLPQTAILHLSVDCLPPDGHLEAISHGWIGQARILRLGQPTAHNFPLLGRQLVAIPHRLQERRHEFAGARRRYEAIHKPVRLVQEHSVVHAIQKYPLTIARVHWSSVGQAAKQ